MRKKVYDILDCGPRNRFTVRGKDGEAMIVHNCTQSAACDLLGDSLLRLDAAGFDIALHCHDEAVSVVPKDMSLLGDYNRLMATTEPWAEGLPLEAEAYIGDRYRK